MTEDATSEMQVSDQSPEGLDIDMPVIYTEDRRLQDITSEALDSLVAYSNTPLIFQRGGFLCRLREKEPGKLVIENINDSILRGILSRSADYRRTEMSNLCPPPGHVIKDILTLDEYPFPYLDAIVSCPILREDGSLLSDPGYDEASSLYYSESEDLEIPDIPESPTKADAIQACNFVMDNVFVDFPFEDDASRANALAGLLSPIVRPMIRGCIPLMLIDKPSPGTGASLIFEIISLISIGRVAEMKSPQGGEQEWRKMITSALKEGPALVYIDNVDKLLKSRSLSIALTSSQWSDRLLGKSEMLSLPQRACWYANGNSLSLGGDLPRRCYLVRIDAKMARPWERDTSKFQHSDIRVWVMENRGMLLAALLTMARAWVVAGRPSGTEKVIGGYTEWVETLDGILKHAGVTGFLDNLEELYNQADEGTDQWQTFFNTWYSIFGDRVVSSKEVVTQLEKLDTDFPTEAPEEISKAMSGEKMGRVIRVGMALSKKHKVRYTNGYMLIKGEDKASSKKTWQLKKIGDEPVIDG